MYAKQNPTMATCPRLLARLLQSKAVQMEAECKRKGEALKEAEAGLKAREQALAALHARLERGTQEMDRKARELDALNRQHQKVMAAVPAGEDAGVLSNPDET